MKIHNVKLTKKQSSKIWKGYEEQSKLSEYETDALKAHKNIIECWYYYFTEPYAGSGQLLAKDTDGKFSFRES